ncbi:DHHC palmitoyltransferase-domain-containing protein [Haematococcus lacustris]
MSGQEQQQHQVNCWACQVLVQIPLVGEQLLPAPRFKCGWCGAITDTFIGRQQQQLMRDQRRRTCFARLMRCLASMQWLVVALVFLLTCSIILLGVAYILPITCHGAPALFAASHVATATLTFLILFNYAATILTSPGTVAECYLPPVKIGEAVPPLAFDNHRFCYECQTFKPPDAHHCSTCRTCVVDLDHHCPFVNNCVGRANMRNFLHFMAATLAAMLFCLAHCLHLIRVYGGKLRQLLGRGKAGLGPGGWDLLTGLGEFLVGCPAPLAAALYISVAGGLVLVSVGSLFWSTVSCLSEGGHGHQHTPACVPGADIRAPAAKARALEPVLRRWTAAWTRGAVNVSRVMGGSGVADWLMPRWGPPDGVLVSSVTKKRS